MRMDRKDIFNPGESICSRIAAYSLVIDSILVTIFIYNVLRSSG